MYLDDLDEYVYIVNVFVLIIMYFLACRDPSQNRGITNCSDGGWIGSSVHGLEEMEEVYRVQPTCYGTRQQGAHVPSGANTKGSRPCGSDAGFNARSEEPSDGLPVSLSTTLSDFQPVDQSS